MKGRRNGGMLLPGDTPHFSNIIRKSLFVIRYSLLGGLLYARPLIEKCLRH
jgi:hypothetical protein